MKRLVYVAVLAVLAVNSAGAASAAGGSCNDAISVLSGVTSGNMAGANSRWLQFTADHTGETVINTSLPETSFETTVGVFRSCGGVPIAYHQGTAQRRAHVKIDSIVGETYYIEIGRISSGGDSFAIRVGQAPQGPCPGAGDCFAANGTPGCDDTCGGPPCPGCCELICGLDPFCCTNSWDGLCEAEAISLCVVIPVELQNFSIDR